MHIAFAKRATDADCRWRPEPQRYPGVRVPEPLPVAISECDLPVSASVSRVPWPPLEIVWRGRSGSRTTQSPGLSPVPRLRALQSIPITSPPAGRIAVVPFGSSDVTLGYPEEELSIQ